MINDEHLCKRLADGYGQTEERKTVLRGERLYKHFTDGSRRTDALTDVSFTLYEGEFLGVAGESGSGKSTLLRAVSGLITLDQGALFCDGINMTGQGPRQMGQHLQMIFQNAESSFDPRMSMERSILENGRGKLLTEDVRRLTKLVHLNTSLLARKPSALSGGQCQRMAIVRALYSGVRILLCDEITSALDVSSQAQIVEILKELKRKRGLSVLFVSHDIALIRNLCDRIMVMQNGRIVESGETEEIIRHPQDPYTQALISSARRQSL